MNQDLMERYIYAVTRRLPRKQREDVSQELRGLIDDMLTERCGRRTPEEKDLRVVLTEIGSPQELYEKYNEDGDKSLIGPPYYSTYKFVMRIVLSATAAGLSITSAILWAMEGMGPWEGIMTWLSIVYQGLLSAFAIVTILFVFFSRKKITLGQPFNFDDLPPVPKKEEVISRWECYAGIVFAVIFLMVFLTAPQLICVFRSEDGTMLSVFHKAAVQDTWYLIVLFAACGITREIVQLLEGRYNRKVLVTKLVTNLLSAVFSIWWLVGFDLMNPVFVSGISDLFAGEAAFIVKIFSNFQYFFLGCILFALALDTLEAVWKTVKK